VQLAAADKHVAELKQQLQDAVEKLKLQSASGFPHSHHLYRITSGEYVLCSDSSSGTVLFQASHAAWWHSTSIPTQVSVHRAEDMIVADRFP